MRLLTLAALVMGCGVVCGQQPTPDTGAGTVAQAGVAATAKEMTVPKPLSWRRAAS